MYGRYDDYRCNSHSEMDLNTRADTTVNEWLDDRTPISHLLYQAGATKKKSKQTSVI